MLLLSAAASSLVPSIIAAIGSVAAALIAAYVVIRAQSYKQLLRDIGDIFEAALENKHLLQEIRDAVAEVLDKTLAAEQRGPVIARYIEETIRRIIREIVGEDPRRRRWYER